MQSGLDVGAAAAVYALDKVLSFGLLERGCDLYRRVRAGVEIGVRFVGLIFIARLHP